LDIHNTTNKHRQNIINSDCLTTDESKNGGGSMSSGKFVCKKCNYVTKRESQYVRHLSTTKHKIRTNTNIVPNNSKVYQCECSKSFRHASSLWNHKQKCDGIPQEPSAVVSNTVDSSLVIELLKQNQEFKEMMMDQHKRMTDQQQKMVEQQDTIIELSKILGSCTINS